MHQEPIVRPLDSSCATLCKANTWRCNNCHPLSGLIQPPVDIWNSRSMWTFAIASGAMNCWLAQASAYKGPCVLQYIGHWSPQSMIPAFPFFGGCEDKYNSYMVGDFALSRLLSGINTQWFQNSVHLSVLHVHGCYMQTWNVKLPSWAQGSCRVRV